MQFNPVAKILSSKMHLKEVPSMCREFASKTQAAGFRINEAVKIMDLMRDHAAEVISGNDLDTIMATRMSAQQEYHLYASAAERANVIKWLNTNKQLIIKIIMTSGWMNENNEEAENEDVKL